MSAFGQTMTDEELKEFISDVDTDGSGNIELEEFIHLMTKIIPQQLPMSPVEEMRAAFDAFDTSGNGTLSVSELAQVMKRLNIDLSEEELNTMVLEADVDGDGEIDFEEFQSMLLQ
jgi:calmodulin